MDYLLKQLKFSESSVEQRSKTPKL